MSEHPEPLRKAAAHLERAQELMRSGYTRACNAALAIERSLGLVRRLRHTGKRDHDTPEA